MKTGIDTMLLWACALSTLFGLGWIVRAVTRGKDAIWMAGAFFALSGLFWGYRAGWPLAALAVLGVFWLVFAGGETVRRVRSGGSRA